MAKKKKEIEELDIASIMEGVAAAVGGEGITSVGIPIPSIAMQWLLDSTVFPLSRVVQLTGNPGAGKSTFLYELMQWFIRSNGFSYLAETEGKPNGLLEAVFQHDAKAIARVTQKSETIYEHWVSNVNRAMSYYNGTVFKQLKAEYPCAFCVDSIVAAAAETTVEEVEKQGFTKATYPELAKLISKNFQMMPEALANKPFSFIFVNHQKEKLDQGFGFGKKTKEMGGAALRYYSMLVLILTKIEEKSFSDRKVRTISIKVDKNNGGPEKRAIEVPVVYSREEDPTEVGAYVQTVTFDWAAADIGFLIDAQGTREGFYTPQKKRLKEICDLNLSKVGATKAIWSKALDIPEDSPLSFTDAGEVLQANDEIVLALQKELCNNRAVGFYGGMKYDAFVKDSKKVSDAKMQELSDAIYGNIANELLKEGKN